MFNTTLVPYGIQTEESDLRVHVCPLIKVVYVFPTANVLPLVLSGKYPLKSVWSYGIETAKGYLIPPFDIPECNMHVPNFDQWPNFSIQDNPTLKGDKAVNLVKNMLQKKQIPLNLNISTITDLNMQIKGTDILVESHIKIQTKCDFQGGHKEIGGTGNLFIQIAECNPYGFR